MCLIGRNFCTNNDRKMLSFLWLHILIITVNFSDDEMGMGSVRLRVDRVHCHLPPDQDLCFPETNFAYIYGFVIQ